ncbi:MAG: alpha/beta fold hydrolase [Pseudomonas sp.]|uniref:thioesterase II family protein n=1 Tax=Pseudomonas sp. TaxID=306 RepID=UPI0033992003
MQDAVQATVIALPFAGGAGHCYRDLQLALPATLPLLTLELPGHGRRIAEPALPSLAAIAADLLPALFEITHQGPYALFGHSMGAYLCALLLRRLAADNLPLPVHVLVSGAGAPGLPRPEPISHLPPAVFLARVRELGGMPDGLLSNPLLLELFTPILLADFHAIETYEHPVAPALRLPISVLRGEADEVSQAAACAWEQECNGPLTLRNYPGGHFFLLEQTAAVARDIASDITRSLQRRVRGPVSA